MAFDSTEGSNLLNIQYSVAFGVVLSFCFRLDASTVKISISSGNLTPFIFLLLYFFWDWITANLLIKRISRLNDMTILFISFGIWNLSAAVILTNSVDSIKYFWLGLYIVVVGIYDICGYLDTLYSYKFIDSIIWVSLAVIKIMLGAFLLMQWFTKQLGFQSHDIQDLYTTEIITIFGLKLWRYAIIKSYLIGQGNQQ